MHCFHVYEDEKLFLHKFIYLAYAARPHFRLAGFYQIVLKLLYQYPSNKHNSPSLFLLLYVVCFCKDNRNCYFLYTELALFRWQNWIQRQSFGLILNRNIYINNGGAKFCSRLLLMMPGKNGLFPWDKTPL